MNESNVCGFSNVQLESLIASLPVGSNVILRLKRFNVITAPAYRIDDDIREYFVIFWFFLRLDTT